MRLENTAGSGDFNGFDHSETTVQLSQRLELEDKLNMRRNSANLSKEIAEWDYEIQRLVVLTRVSKSFTHVLKAQQKIFINSRRCKTYEKVFKYRIRKNKKPAKLW